MRRSTREPSDSGQRGAALVLVLWIAMALTVIGAAMSTSLQRELRATQAILDAAQTRQAARAGISRGLTQIRNLEIGEMHQLALGGAAGEWHRFELDGIPVRYRFFSELGRIDLNRAERDLLQGLLLAAGANPAQLDRLVDNILDWRDTSTETRLHGTSPEAYRALGLLEGRRDGHFESVEELQQVAGFNPELYRRVAPYLTVHSGARRPAPEYAPQVVLAAYPGIDPETAGHWAREREVLFQGGRGALPPFPGGTARGGSSSVFGVETVAGAPGRASARIEVVFDVRPGDRLPFTLLEWREPPIWAPGHDPT